LIAYLFAFFHTHFTNTHHKQHLVDELTKQHETAKKKVNNLKRLSVESLLALVVGNREVKIAKEEKELYTVVSHLQAARQALATSQKNYDEAIKKLQSTRKSLTTLQQCKLQLKTLIQQAFEDQEQLLQQQGNICNNGDGNKSQQQQAQHKQRIRHPEELAAKKIVYSLSSQLQTIKAAFHLHSMCLQYLTRAFSNVQECQFLLNEAKEIEAEQLFAQGTFIDSLKYDKLAQARDIIAATATNVQMAMQCKLEPPLPVTVSIPAIANGDVFMDLFTDDDVFTFDAVQAKIEMAKQELELCKDQIFKAIQYVSHKQAQLEESFESIKKQYTEAMTLLMQTRIKILSGSAAVSNTK